MDTSANIITTMGIIADEVYKNDYFTLKADGTLSKDMIEGTNYKVIDHTPADNQGFNALLLESMDSTGKGSGEYVIAFRGTQEKLDIVEDEKGDRHLFII